MKVTNNNKNALIELSGQYRRIDELLRHETQGKGHLELVDLKEVKDSEENLGET